VGVHEPLFYSGLGRNLYRRDQKYEAAAHSPPWEGCAARRVWPTVSIRRDPIELIPLITLPLIIRLAVMRSL
jgi:hypothetical protein